MRKALALGLLSLSIFAGCGGASIPVQMNIDTSSKKPAFLMGEVTRAGGFAFQKINFKAENLNMSCKGQSLNGQVQIASNGLFKDRYKHKFPIECSDGSVGMVMLELTIEGASGVVGTGYGEMESGSAVRISIGNTNGGIVW